MEKNEFDGIVLREKERSLFMSRVPKDAKDKFVEIANNYFCSDYGMTFLWCLEQALEYKKVKKLLFDDKFLESLEYYINNLDKNGNK